VIIHGKVFRGALYPDPYELMKALAPLEGKQVLIEVRLLEVPEVEALEYPEAE
jgi:hypothetical protein